MINSFLQRSNVLLKYIDRALRQKKIKKLDGSQKGAKSFTILFIQSMYIRNDLRRFIIKPNLKLKTQKLRSKSLFI